MVFDFGFMKVYYVFFFVGFWVDFGFLVLIIVNLGSRVFCRGFGFGFFFRLRSKYRLRRVAGSVFFNSK